VAQRLTDPERTSPTAKTPGTLVSRMPSAPAFWPARTKPSSSSATVPPSQSVLGAAPRKRKRKRRRAGSARDRGASPPRAGRRRRPARRSRCVLGQGRRRANRQLRAADPRREAEVVLDPPRRTRLAAESAALDHERVSSPAEGFRSSGPPGRRTSGISLFASPEIWASPPTCSGRSVSTHVNGSRLRRANSTSRRVASDECGPTISAPTPSRA
jgi:hypothetical protein